MDFDPIIRAATRNVPARLKADAVQASYIGILKGQGRATNNAPGYLYKCARHEVLELLAQLAFPMRLTKQQLLEAWRNEKEKITI
jgi:hypothetical protein